MKKLLILTLLISSSIFAHEFQYEVGSGDYICSTHGRNQRPYLARANTKSNAMADALELCSQNWSQLNCQKNMQCEKTNEIGTVTYAVSRYTKDTDSNTENIVIKANSSEKFTCNIQLGRLTALIKASNKIEAKAIAHLFCEDQGYFNNFCAKRVSDC